MQHKSISDSSLVNIVPELNGSQMHVFRRIQKRYEILFNLIVEKVMYIP